MSSRTEARIESSHLAGLHLLRFFLTLSILIVHFPHFFFPFGEAANPARSDLPLSSLLARIYDYGGFAVEIFWMISGVIFYIFYLNDVRNRQVSFSTFLGYRISRLYPLHLATLLSVAVLQKFYAASHDGSFVYQNNDVTHFILNVLMINFWNAKFGLSFNGPFWSVSVEMFFYLVFFLFALIGLLERTKNLVILTAFFFSCYVLGILSPFYECLLYFFAGTLLVHEMHRLTPGRMLGLFAFIVAALAIRSAYPVLHRGFEVKRIVDTAIKLPIAVLTVAAFTRLFTNLPPRMHNIMMELGNLTYAVYMIHISVQLLLILVFQGMEPGFFNTLSFFAGYILLSLTAGFFVYRWFEMPAQKYLRSFIKAKPRTPLSKSLVGHP